MSLRYSVALFFQHIYFDFMIPRYSVTLFFQHIYCDVMIPRQCDSVLSAQILWRYDTKIYCGAIFQHIYCDFKIPRYNVALYFRQTLMLFIIFIVYTLWILLLTYFVHLLIQMTLISFFLWLWFSSWRALNSHSYFQSLLSMLDLHLLVQTKTDFAVLSSFFSISVIHVFGTACLLSKIQDIVQLYLIPFNLF